MEKEIIINFFNEHWDEFASLLSETTDPAVGRTLVERFPDDIYEFANVLSKMITVRQMHAADKQKGLLKRAQQFRKTDSVKGRESEPAIIMKNGLFVVQPRQHSEILDMSFKNLVDSVL